MNALKKKLEGNLNERLKLRENEHNKLLQRYQNVKKEIENQQNIEKIKFEKAFANYKVSRPETANMMRSVIGSRMSGSVQNKLGTNRAPTGNPASKPSYLV